MMSDVCMTPGDCAEDFQRITTDRDRYRSALAELVRAQKRYELSLQSSQEEHKAATGELEAAWAAAMALIPEE